MGYIPIRIHCYIICNCGTVVNHNFKGVIIMDAQVIGQLIASLGFPIVAAAAMFWMVNKNEERHKDEIGDLRKTIEDNTSVLSSLKELIQIIINRGE